MKQQSNTTKIIQEDEVDIREFFSVVWQGKLWIILFVVLSSAISIWISLSLPDIYKSEAFLSSNAGGMSEIGKISNKYGGLASLAGIAIPSSGTNKAELGIEILQSRAFIGSFIEKHDILAPLMAAKSWNKTTKKLTFDSSLYNQDTREWVREAEPPETSKPSIQKAYKAFSGILDVAYFEGTGFVTISIQHLSPEVARQWVDWLIEDINDEIRQQDLAQARRSIKYLEQQIESTSLTELKSGFFDLIQQQTETIMLASANPEYLFRTIDPAVVPEEKFKPERFKICFFGAFVGFIIGVVVATLKHYLSRN